MEKEISKIVVEILKLRLKVSVENIEFQTTRKEFKGDITIVLFPLLNKTKKTPNPKKKKPKTNGERSRANQEGSIKKNPQ